MDGPTSNAAQVGALWAAAALAAGEACRAVTKHHATLLQARIKAHASGRPGPRMQSGDYNRSWEIRGRGQKGIAKFEVGTDKPQGRRLEYGFVGTDSLGRRYNQPPYPHVAPAVDETYPGFVADLLAVNKALLTGKK